MALSFGVHDNFISHTRQSSPTDIRELDNNEIALVSGQFAAAAAPLLYTAAEYIAIGICAVGTIMIAKYFNYSYGYDKSRNYYPSEPATVTRPPTDWDNWKVNPPLVLQRCY